MAIKIRSLPTLVMIGALTPFLWVVGCADSFGPRDVSGTYVLERLSGKPLPTLLWVTQFDRWTLLADTLTLLPDKSGLIRGILRRESRDGEATPIVVINNLPVVLEVRPDGQMWLREEYGCLASDGCAPAEYRIEFPGTAAEVQRSEGVARYRRISRAP